MSIDKLPDCGALKFRFLDSNPLVGQVLAAVGEAQAGGDITTRAEALDLACRLLAARR